VERAADVRAVDQTGAPVIELQYGAPARDVDSARGVPGLNGDGLDGTAKIGGVAEGRGGSPVFQHFQARAAADRAPARAALLRNLAGPRAEQGQKRWPHD